MKNMKEFCGKCKYAEEPSDKDPCKSCMDFGIAALGRPANFRETAPEMRKIGDRIEEVYQNLVYCSEQSACSDERCKYYNAYPHCDNALMREAAQVLNLLVKERNQAVDLLKEVVVSEGFCTGCLYDLGALCTHPQKGERECSGENNYWEWRGIFEEEGMGR